MDVKTTFLSGEIEEVYIEQPDGFVIHEKESHVQVEEGLVWTQASTLSLVCED